MTSDLHQRRRPPTDEELSNIPWLTLLLPKELERAVNALRVGDAEKGDFVCRVGRPVTYWFGNVSGLLKMSTQFKADMTGSFEGDFLTLKEDFYWTDGEKQNRIWKIKKIDQNYYEGTAPDVVGTAKGYQYGSAFKFEYDLMVPFKGKNIKVSFDDWIFKQDEDVAINRATLTKFGFKVGELTVFFKKN